ncbi:polysaccharide biosynthesis tyrosine autokinase [Blastococcus saxobsidens]|uniref:non-specific protein-tyrosine kinase n=1 Tax=Blastococcus saxobsidens TaxID=138336 RepID=A0A4Q7YDV6_9ACTN|nr:polysaccharide biosynthesis tyrosine autokinase [Blastococcus saxobsidens]RZU34455.1 capsular exopolysaccharide synthesis family protein [Blastococcus saxobsidens]
MNTRGALHVLRRRWTAVLATTVVGLLGGLVYSATAPVTHEATAGAFFSLVSGSSASDLVQGSTYAQNQVESFAQLARTPEVLQPVIDELGLAATPAQLAAQIEPTVPTGTVIVQVTATDESAERSAALANAVIISLSDVVERIAPKDEGGRSTVVATTVAPAEVPTAPASPDVPLAVVAGLVLGLLAGFALAWLLEAFDTRVRDAEVVAELTDLPVVGSLPAWPADSGQVVVTAAPHSPAAESFRQLRTNLEFLRVGEGGVLDEGRAQVLAVTSALSGEGKSTVSVNLAATLAETGARVLLVDADLRRPAVAGVLGIEGGVGLTTVLAGQADVEDVVQEWGPVGLHVLPSGAVPPNPAELLSSPAMRALMARLRGTYQYVVVDTTPVLPVADATVLSRVVDGMIVVANARRVRRRQVGQTLAGLAQVSARVLGVVLNQVRRDEEAYSYARTPSAAEPADGALQASADPVARQPVG